MRAARKSMMHERAWRPAVRQESLARQRIADPFLDSDRLLTAGRAITR
jgi:hypothetical protein